VDNPNSTRSTDNAFCLACGYPLRALPTSRCPECGRPFDPADPRTMSLGQPLRPWQRWLLRPTGWPTIALALLGTAALAYLSRWPRLLPEPPLVLLDEFHWPRPYMMPPTAPDIMFYTAVVLWAALIAWTVFWQLARLLLVPRTGRRANVWGIDTHSRHRAIAAAAIVSIFCMIFGWQQRIGQRWVARVMAPVSPLGRRAPAFRYQPKGDPWRHSPVELSPDQGREALSHVIVELPTGKERLSALRSLVEGTGRAALPSLVHAAATETDENLLVWELRLIGLCRDAETAPLLIDHLRDAHPAVRAAAADAVGILHHPAYSVGVPDGFYLSPAPLALDTKPPIDLAGVVATERSGRALNFNGGWAQHDLVDDPTLALDRSVRDTLQAMMLGGPTPEEREAAARALVSWPPPDQYQFRVAEWAVWVNANGHMALAKSVLDEIPPFVHRTGNPVSSFFGAYFLYPSEVAKPVMHLSSDVPLAADVEVQIREGRPWFAYPKPDDFGIGVLPDSQTSRPLNPGWMPLPPTARPPRTPGVQAKTTRPAVDDFDSPPIASLADCREGYPWLRPNHRLYPTSGMVPIRIYRLGLRWQSLIVTPTRLPWMTPPTVPADPHFRWWERLREVPSCWVANRGETERFLYYDGPTRAPVPVDAELASAGRRIRLTSVRDEPATYNIDGKPKILLRGMEPQPRPDLREHEGFFIQVHAGQVRARAVAFDGDCYVRADPDPALTGEPAVAGQLRAMLLRYGLTGPEADGLIAAWAPQFFRAEGRRFLLRMSPAEYARQCPMQVRPPPTEVVRLGLVLTEFDPQPPTTRPAPH
jgi:hypothetical protein